MADQDARTPREDLIQVNDLVRSLRPRPGSTVAASLALGDAPDIKVEMSGMEQSRAFVRHYRDEDRRALLALADRLTIGIAPWRSDAGMRAAAQSWVETSVSRVEPEGAVYVAERNGEVVGFASVVRERAFTGEAQAYIGELAVATEVEGQGVGQALLAAAEAWARVQDLSLLVLDTGAANTRGRRFYAMAGFQEESVRLTKVLLDPDTSRP